LIQAALFSLSVGDSHILPSRTFTRYGTRTFGSHFNSLNTHSHFCNSHFTLSVPG